MGDQIEGVLRHEAKILTARVAGTLKKAGSSAKGIVLSESPGSRLVALADRGQAGLIVVGSRNRRREQEYFMGTVDDIVMPYTPCPVSGYGGRRAHGL